MRIAIIVTCIAFIAPLYACGGGGGTDSPKAVAEAIAKAASSQDAAIAIATLPPVDQLEAHFDCPADQSLVEARNKRAERAAKEFEGERSKGMTMTIAAFDLEGSETKAIKTGETWKGCKVKKDIEIHKPKLTLKIEKDGEVDDDGETWRFLKLDGKWYFAKL